MAIWNFAIWPFGVAFPIRDWQFWLATALFIAAVGWLLRGVLPVPFLSKRHKRRKGQTRATLTVGGKIVKK